MWLLAIALDSADLDSHSSRLCSPQALLSALIYSGSLSFPTTHMPAPTTELCHLWSPFPRMFSPPLPPNSLIWLATTFPSLPQITLSIYLFTRLWVKFYLSPTALNPPTSQDTSSIWAGILPPCPSLYSHHLNTTVPGSQEIPCQYLMNEWMIAFHSFNHHLSRRQPNIHV